MLEIKLGLAGTAKNTGKTTTTAAIIEELRVREVPFFLTSIGYDGENLDNITGLPKPKLRVAPGDMVATAEKCLTASTAAFQTLTDTHISTPLGRIMIAKVTKAGLVVTAGPNKSSEVRELANLMRQISPGVMIFDGALNRIAPMVETDGFILATGASKTPDIGRLAQETELIWKLSSLPYVPQAVQLSERGMACITLLDARLHELKTWSMSSLLTADDVQKVLNQPPDDGSYLYIPGIIGEKALNLLVTHIERQPRRLVLTFADPIKLLVAGSSVVYFEAVERLEQAGVFVGVLKRIPLLGVTINPFYPEYRVESKNYQPAFVDFTRLQVSVQKNIRVPVYNVVKQGARGLVDIIMAHAKRWESPQVVHF